MSECAAVMLINTATVNKTRHISVGINGDHQHIFSLPLYTYTYKGCVCGVGMCVWCGDVCVVWGCVCGVGMCVWCGDVCVV